MFARNVISQIIRECCCSCCFKIVNVLLKIVLKWWLLNYCTLLWCFLSASIQYKFTRLLEPWPPHFPLWVHWQCNSNQLTVFLQILKKGSYAKRVMSLTHQTNKMQHKECKPHSPNCSQRELYSNGSLVQLLSKTRRQYTSSIRAVEFIADINKTQLQLVYITLVSTYYLFTKGMPVYKNRICGNFITSNVCGTTDVWPHYYQGLRCSGGLERHKGSPRWRTEGTRNHLKTITMWVRLQLVCFCFRFSLRKRRYCSVAEFS